MEMPAGQLTSGPAPSSDNNEIGVANAGYKRIRIVASLVTKGPSESETNDCLSEGKWVVQHVTESL